jgi:hypothetical protein
MSSDFEKYAVYWMPDTRDSLARFGCAWTGWCADEGHHGDRSRFGDLAVDIPAITRSTGRYGLLAPIKAPFRLAPGCSDFALQRTLRELSETAAGFPLPRLRLAVIDGRVALVPRRAEPAVGQLLDGICDGLARLDATAPERGFADAGPQEEFTVSESGPVVQLPTAEQHRFNMPLTDRLELDVAFRVLRELQSHLAPIMEEPRVVHDVALVGDPGGGRKVRILQRFELRRASVRHVSDAMACSGPHMLAPHFGERVAASDIAV